MAYCIWYSKVPKFMSLNLPFMSFKLSFYFNHLSHFELLCSLAFHCCYCLATTLPSFSAIVISHTPLSLPTSQQNCPISVPFCAISYATCLLLHHFLSAHPSLYFAAQQIPKHKIVFPSTFFTLCLLTTQIKSLPPSHKL